MASPAEQFKAESFYSPVAADLVRGVLEGYVEYLLANGFTNAYKENGKEVLETGIPVLYDPEYEEDIGTAFRAEQRQAGYVDRLAIARDQDGGRIASAEVSVILPAQISDDEAGGWYRGDGWRARLQFPRPKHQDSCPRVVLDAYRVPLTQLSRGLRAIEQDDIEAGQAEYGELSNRIFKEKDAAGLPLETRDRVHIVLGRDQELDPATHDLLKAILGFFDQGVRDEVAWLRMTDVSDFADASEVEKDRGAMDQLRQVLAGIRAQRQAQKAQIESPFGLLKGIVTTDGNIKLPRKKVRSAAAEERVRAQIAAGPAVRAARAARRAAQAKVGLNGK